MMGRLANHIKSPIRKRMKANDHTISEVLSAISIPSIPLVA
jgi:hypothetical protein